MIASIAFLACLGNDCEPIRVRVYDDMTPLFCALKGGQEIAADWMRRHPGYELGSRIKCEARP